MNDQQAELWTELIMEALVKNVDHHSALGV